MSVQETFDKVINAGIYASNSIGLMCYALLEAACDGVISKEEMKAAKAEIKEYLGANGSLGGKLLFNNMPYTFEHRLAIYKDWANRPVLK